MKSKPELKITLPDEHIPTREDMLRYAQGDKTVVNPIIEGLTSFIVDEMQKFSKYNTYARNYEDDCVSAALLELVEFVNKNLGKTYDAVKFMLYIRTSCFNRVNDMLRTIGYAVDVQKDYVRMGGEIHQVKMQDYHQAELYEEPFDQVWFDEFIDDLHIEDQKILRLKMAGYSNREIEDRLGLDHHFVQDLLNRMELFYKEGKYVETDS